MQDITYMGNRFIAQSNGRAITVKVIEIEQKPGRHRGKWACLNETTGRRIHRTSRQLRPLPQ
jgi:hypothetical protein